MNDKIMGLLKNLILNNIASTQIAKFCKNQQQSNIPSTNQQPLLLSSVFLEDSEKIDKWICILYKNLMPDNKFTFNSLDRHLVDQNIKLNIIKTLQTKGISYFDEIAASDSRDIDIFPPEDFIKSLTSLTSLKSLTSLTSLKSLTSLSNPFRGIIISDKLVNSMFALSVVFLTSLEKLTTITVKYTVDPIECPP